MQFGQNLSYASYPMASSHSHNIHFSNVLPKKDKESCTKMLKTLMETLPTRNEYSIPSIFLTDLNNTGECDDIMPFIAKVRDTLRRNDFLNVISEKSTVETERLSHTIILEHKKEIDTAVRKDYFMNKPFDYIRNYLFR